MSASAQLPMAAALPPKKRAILQYVRDYVRAKSIDKGVTYVDHGTWCGRRARWRWGGGAGERGCCAPVEARAQIESSTRDRARICKYRHIYKRKGSPERRANAALRGNQSGEIPSASDRKMSNELRVHHSVRVSGTRRGRHSTAALLSPQLG
ncbi:hypothetical protein RR46_13991 [Papilio xuthus]|uniref:Uncharacterized protein n=1 Tax=Papilio xuthus TaxID=66420 RepID=A0A194PNR7_PAPXU|nr:hypothetical protein RR46_13991 [Papilio xuthus]